MASGTARTTTRVGIEEQSKELIRRSCEEFWNKGDVEAIDKFYAPGYVSHDPGGLHEGDLAHHRQSAQAIFSAIPDLRLHIEDLIAEGDKVVKRWTATGTHKGAFMGIPASGNSLEVTGTTTYRVAEGKLVESWWNTDSLTMLQQMGAIPPLK